MPNVLKLVENRNGELKKSLTAVDGVGVNNVTALKGCRKQSRPKF